MNIGFLASGGGTNMQAIIDACKSGDLKATPAIVISNNSKSGAMERAENEAIPRCHLSSKTDPLPEELDAAMLDVLLKHNVDLVVLVGYMKKLGTKVIDRFRGRILNIHPALLPKFGGKGMYGIHVHEAVIASGDRETGVTIHVVDPHYDRGAILAQVRVPVEEGDTPKTLQKRVLKYEHQLFTETLQKIASGELELPEG